jgi:transcriptional regulator with XRE-family HTH domain
MGVTQSVVGRLEGGRHSPSVDTLAQFAAAAGYELRIAFVKPRQGATAGLKPLRAATAGQKRRTMASDRGNAVRADATRR